MGIILLFPTITEIPSALRPFKIKSGGIHIVKKNKLEYKIVCTGTGRKVSEVITNLSPHISEDICVLMGYGGALNPFLKVGDGIICENFYAKDEEEIQTHPLLIEEIINFLHANNVNIIKGNSYTVDQVVSNLDSKNFLAKKGAHIVEMENYWAAKTAFRLGLPFISIRFVLDTFYDKLPDLTHTVKADGTVSIPVTCNHLMNNPKDSVSMAKIFLITQYIAPKIKTSCKVLSLLSS